MNYFSYITPFIYLILVLIWAYILVFYLRKVTRKEAPDKLLKTLLVVLMIDAFRTLLESTFFGVWYTSLAGIIPIQVYNFLAQPQIVFFPKITNLIVSVIILIILIKRWIPAESTRIAEQKEYVEKQTFELKQTIEELSKAKDELIVQQQLFEIMFNTIPDGVVITNTKREIQLANRGMKSTFGYNPEEIIGKTTQILYADKLKYKSTGDSLYNEDSPRSENLYINYYKTKDNLEFPGETFGTKLYDNNGEWKGNLGIMRNVSERMRFINDIQKEKERAEESDRLKSAFLANMSHEIRTPMNGILGFLEILEDTDLSLAERKNYTGIVSKSGNRLLETINNIIEISKIESGQIQENIDSLDVTEALRDMYKFFLPQTDIKGLELVNSNENSPPLVIGTDRNKLNSILTNLIKNAIKFTTSGSIEFGYELQKDKLLFTVNDTGKGIPEPQIEKMFDRFIQADNSLNREHEGSGLGLSIAKSYSEQLGGEIGVESSLGKGSSFYFTIEKKESLNQV